VTPAGSAATQPGDIAIDSSALVSVLLEEPWSGAYLNALLVSGMKVISAFNLFESTVVLEARKGPAGSLVLDSFCAALEIDVAPFTPQHARLAAEAWRRYGKGRHPAGLNLGDCCAYALARSTGLPLLASGDDFPKTDIRLVTVETA
jgi:ribonuclease VapC